MQAWESEVIVQFAKHARLLFFRYVLFGDSSEYAEKVICNTLDACKAIPFKVVVIGKLFTSFTAALCEDPHPSLPMNYPFLCAAIRVARMIQVPGPASPLCCIYQ
jgi:hypothetical protein